MAAMGLSCSNSALLPPAVRPGKPRVNTAVTHKLACMVHFMQNRNHSLSLIDAAIWCRIMAAVHISHVLLQH
ncbi:hypothetical protein [Paraburkholderia panacisoli]|uniref:hypothetical protein n=1 Tax=Paraburkholderia panacisoli TaxID=2603818 RepID=UPI00165F867D|nr:hypothetical protein [Paraburkholderia panacisoli]